MDTATIKQLQEWMANEKITASKYHCGHLSCLQHAIRHIAEQAKRTTELANDGLETLANIRNAVRSVHIVSADTSTLDAVKRLASDFKALHEDAPDLRSKLSAAVKRAVSAEERARRAEDLVSELERKLDSCVFPGLQPNYALLHRVVECESQISNMMSKLNKVAVRAETAHARCDKITDALRSVK